MWSHVQSVDVDLVLGTWYDFAIEYIGNRTLQVLFSLIFFLFVCTKVVFIQWCGIFVLSIVCLV